MIQENLLKPQDLDPRNAGNETDKDEKKPTSSEEDASDEDSDDSEEGYDILPSNDSGISADDNAYGSKREGEHDA